MFLESTSNWKIYRFLIHRNKTWQFYVKYLSVFVLTMPRNNKPQRISICRRRSIQRWELLPTFLNNTWLIFFEAFKAFMPTQIKMFEFSLRIQLNSFFYYDWQLTFCCTITTLTNVFFVLHCSQNSCFCESKDLGKIWKGILLYLNFSAEFFCAKTRFVHIIVCR